MWRRPAAVCVRLAPIVVVFGCGPGDGGRHEAASVPTPATASAPATGRVVYETRCAPCHGVEGRGDGPAAADITPKPRNFHDPDFWKGRSAAQLQLVVRDGKPGTLMPPFEGALAKEQIDAVVSYIQAFRPAAP